MDLAVAQEVVLNLTLEVGTTAEQVTVTGEAPLVELRYSESVKSARSSLARFARPNWPGSATSIFRDDVRCDRLSNARTVMGLLLAVPPRIHAAVSRWRKRPIVERRTASNSPASSLSGTVL